MFLSFITILIIYTQTYLFVHNTYAFVVCMHVYVRVGVCILLLLFTAGDDLIF